MNSYLYTRYLWLLNTLLRYKRLSFTEISRKWEDSYLYEGKPLNLRTFHDHRNAVEEMFHVSIECDSADGYRYYIEDASSLENDKLRQWMLNSFNVSNLVNEGQQMFDRILLEDVPSGSEYLSTVIEAMKQNHVLEIEYQPFYENASAVYHLQPYCMRMYHQRWYILGKTDEQKGLCQFSLDRILQMELTDTAFDYPKDFSPQNYYAGSIGIWVNEKVKAERVVLRAIGQTAQYLSTLPLHPSQKMSAETDKHSDFEYQVAVTHELVCTILSKGRYLKVLSPRRLQMMVEEEARDITKQYENYPKKNGRDGKATRDTQLSDHL